VKLCRTIDDMINRLQSKVNGHELNYWCKTHEGSSTTNSSETTLSDRSVPESMGTVLIDESFCDFVGTMIIGNFFSNDEDIGVSGKLLVQGFVESFSIGDFCEISHKRLGEVAEHNSNK